MEEGGPPLRRFEGSALNRATSPTLGSGARTSSDSYNIGYAQHNGALNMLEDMASHFARH